MKMTKEKKIQESLFDDACAEIAMAQGLLDLILERNKFSKPVQDDIQERIEGLDRARKAIRSIEYGTDEED